MNKKLLDKDIFFIAVTVVDSDVQNGDFLDFLEGETSGTVIGDRFLVVDEQL
jgi:hypothetical protein